jgi:acetyl esterase/lipase
MPSRACVVVLCVFVFIPAIVLASVATSEPTTTPIVVPLWPNLPPATSPDEDHFESHADIDGKTILKAAYNVTHPDIEIYFPPSETNTGAAMIAVPGGGFTKLDIDKEGFQVARWANDHGIACIVLKYRLPHGESGKGMLPYPVQDAARAVRIVRLRANEWKIDPKCIGVIGFSAGGYVTSTLETHYDLGNPKATDPIDRVSCRPDFSILCYAPVSYKTPPSKPPTRPATQPKFMPLNPTTRLLDEYANDEHVDAHTPPTFIVQASDDSKDDPRGSIYFYSALLKNKVPCELHMWAVGEHGFGMGVRGGEPTQWPNLLLTWLKTEKIIPK